MPDRRTRVAVLLLAVVLAGCSPGPEPTPAPAPDAELARRAAHTATALGDGTALVAGGCIEDGCGVATASVALLSPSGSRSTAPLRTARDAHTATLLADGRVLVVGGFEGEGRPALAGAEIYDPRTSTWSSTGSLRVGRGGHAAARLGDGQVLVVGGWVSSGRYTAATELYDPRTGRFSPGPDLPEAVMSLAATSLPDGRVLVTGGQRSGTVASALAVVVGSDGSVRHVPAGLTTPRFKHAAVPLPSGAVLVLGGTADDHDLLTGTEVFDPASGTFGRGPSLRGGRYKLSDAAVALPDGRVVIAGSGPGVEVVDLAQGRSSVVPDLADVAAAFSTVSLVGDGIWVLGGYDRSIRLTGTDRRLALADL